MASISRIAFCLAGAFATVTPAGPVAAQGSVSARSSLAQAAELEQLVAPIALYPDALLSQILMASTYPLEVVEAARWRKAHPDLQGEALESALQDQDWDPSVKSLAAFPTVLEMMNERLSWTSRLGDVFLAQQDALMDTVQALRARAQAAGNLNSSSEQTVTVTPSSGGSTVIRIEPARPEVVYVPIYDPAVVYGPWLYPAFPPFYWHPPGYAVAGTVFSFGVGLFIGHALWSGYDWHAHRVKVVNVHHYNRFNRTRFSHVDWKHDPHHRRNVAYRLPSHGHGFHGGDSRFASRENYRPRADGFRRELPHIDRTALHDRGAAWGNGQHGMLPRGAPGRPPGRAEEGPRASGLDRPVQGGRRPNISPRGPSTDRGRDVTVRAPGTGVSRPSGGVQTGREGGWGAGGRSGTPSPHARPKWESGPARGVGGPQAGRPFGGREMGGRDMGRGSMGPPAGGSRGGPSSGGGRHGGRLN